MNDLDTKNPKIAHCLYNVALRFCHTVRGLLLGVFQTFLSVHLCMYVCMCGLCKTFVCECGRLNLLLNFLPNFSFILMFLAVVFLANCSAAAQGSIKILHFPGEKNNKAKMTAIHSSNTKMHGKQRQMTTRQQQQEQQQQL